MSAFAIGIRVAGLSLLLWDVCRAQEYPRWFLDEGDIPCTGCAVGVAEKPYYPDSTGGAGFVMGVENCVRNQMLKIEGKKEYMSTEDGTMVLSTTVAEEFDSSQIEPLSRTLKLLATFSYSSFFATLIGPSECSIPSSFLVNTSMAGMPQPSWVSAPPHDSRFHYAVGSSESYYYEWSSWNEAEKNARLELARSIHSKVREVGYVQNSESLSSGELVIRDEDLGNTTLRDIRVLHRWRNPANDVFYVLLRMPK